MNNLKKDIAAIRDLHREGQWEKAKKGYLAILKKHPNEVEVLHELGILSAQLNDFSTAVEYLQSAVEIEPSNPLLQINYGNALKALGLFTQAASALQTAIELQPHNAHALNNLGAVYFAQGNLDNAIQQYRLAIEAQPNYVNAYYNLGLALFKQNELNAATEAFNTLLTHEPKHGPARFQLGCILLVEDKLDEAIACYETLEKQHPYHVETHINLATCYLKKGFLNEAKTRYLKALELTPTDTQILFNIGVINMQQGLTDSAIQYYQRVLNIAPDDFAAHNNIGVAFLAKHHVGFALQHFQEAARLQPQNEAIRYTVTMLSQNQQLHASPPDYIKTLFDAYADHYEPHLLQSLEYRIPELLFEAVRHSAPTTDVQWDILDLGCGTGLCGMPFKPLAKTLAGVDLSPNMLQVAAQKQIYDELIAEDLSTFLAAKHTAYDLVIAGDVFVYIGKLDELFASISQALRDNGLLAFNTEMTDKADYTMNQSGRFAHQKSYLDNLAEQHHFQILHYEKVMTRQQNNEPVHGHLYVLQKK